MTPLTTLGLGLLLGLKHAFDSDHLIAVSTIVARERSWWQAGQIGLLWGLGHTLTLLLVGLIVLGFNIDIPTPVGLSLECMVGVVLVGLGVSTLSACWRKKLHVHSHSHNEAVHTHFHTHAETATHTHVHLLRLGLRPLLIGMVHGLAGSAALMLLVLTAIPSPMLGLFYSGLFGCGSILGMGAISLLMGFCFSLATHRFEALNRLVHGTIGALSTAFGVWIIVDIGFVQGLFLG
jgi:hypothetical protein